MRSEDKLLLITLAIITVGVFASRPLHAQRRALKNHPGKVIYEKYNCMACHGKTGTTPFDLTKAYQKYDDTTLIRYIKDPMALGNNRMPAFQDVIAESEYNALVAYVVLLGKNNSPD